jgi:hypothetical protein
VKRVRESIVEEWFFEQVEGSAGGHLVPGAVDMGGHP